MKYKIAIVLALLPAFLLVRGCRSRTPSDGGGWYSLRWIEKPSARGPSRLAAPEDKTSFALTFSFAEKEGGDAFKSARDRLREGDVIAYRKDKGTARREILKGKLNTVGYRLLKYGHLAIVVKDANAPDRLRLFSSQSFKGPNIREDVDSLATHDWDAYRLDKWERVSADRLHEFVRLATAKAGKWYGYDFSGMFGLWNSNLTPASPKQIGHDYICSTIVVAALYYAGLELDAVQRGGIADLVSPLQVVSSKGRLIPPPEVEIKVRGGK